MQSITIGKLIACYRVYLIKMPAGVISLTIMSCATMVTLYTIKMWDNYVNYITEVQFLH